jgi:hypothetical protein
LGRGTRAHWTAVPSQRARAVAYWLCQHQQLLNLSSVVHLRNYDGQIESLISLAVLVTLIKIQW